jgi:hypothetical protein
MKTIRNKTPRPMKIRLPGGKTLHLGPAKSGQISDKAAAHATIRKLADDGLIELIDHEAPVGGGTRSASPTQESTHGHSRTGIIVPKGDR